MGGNGIIHMHLDAFTRANTRQDAALHKRFRGLIPTRGEPPSTTTCNHCQDQAGGIQMHPSSNGCFLSAFTAGRCCAAECNVPVTKQ